MKPVRPVATVRTVRTVRAKAIATVTLTFGLEAALLVACGSSGGNLKDTADSQSTKNYGGAGSSSQGSSSSPFMVPMNFVDGAVVVTYPDASASSDALADSSLRDADADAAADAAAAVDAKSDAPDALSEAASDAALSVSVDAAADVEADVEADGGDSG
jgi:hypothetical protein